jgi:hypothetical protein
MINPSLYTAVNESGHSALFHEPDSHLNHSDIFKLLVTHLQCYALENEYQQKLSRDEKLGALSND